MFNRIFLIVLDSVGCGPLPDAAQYDDAGSNTLLHIFQNIKDFSLPHLFRLGLGRVMGVPSPDHVTGVYGKMGEKSAGKDTPSGHWEMSGAVLKDPFPTYPSGFPDDLLQKFLKATHMKGYLGTKVASGTEITKEL
ncbi:MAG: phosphopentomutase, partial [bacterium]|nr:phosphopentomutase [bacterium]